MAGEQKEQVEMHPVYEDRRHLVARDPYHHFVKITNLIETDLQVRFSRATCMINFRDVLANTFRHVSQWLRDYVDCQSCNRPMYLHSVSFNQLRKYPLVMRYDPRLNGDRRFVLDPEDKFGNGSDFPPKEQVRHKLNRLETLVHKFKGSMSRLNWDRSNVIIDETPRSRRLLALIATAESEIENMRRNTYKLWEVMRFLSITGFETLESWMETPYDKEDAPLLIDDYIDLSQQILDALDVVERDTRLPAIEGVPNEIANVRRLLSENGIATTYALQRAKHQLVTLVGVVANHVDLHDANYKENEFQRGALIARGDFGDYFSCTINGVAATAERVTGRGFLNASARRELQIELIRWKHDRFDGNLQTLMGTVIAGNRLYLITAVVGNVLRDIIHGNPELDIPPAQGDGETRLQFLKYAMNVSQALEYLELRGVVHYNLSSSAVLIRQDGTVALSRVGFHLSKQQLRRRRGEGRLITEYQAPEVLKSDRWSHAADTFSFGVLLWELVHRAVPHQTLDPSEIVQRVYYQGRTMPSDEDLAGDRLERPMALENLIRECLAYMSYDRPPIGEVRNKLQEFIVDSKKRSKSLARWVDPTKVEVEEPVSNEEPDDYNSLGPANLVFRDKSIAVIFTIMERTMGWPEYQVEALRELKLKTDVARESNYRDLATRNFASVLRDSIEQNIENADYMRLLFAVLRNLGRFSDTNKGLYQQGIPQLVIRTLRNGEYKYLNKESNPERIVDGIKALWEMATNTSNRVKSMLVHEGIIEYVCTLCNLDQYTRSFRRITKLYGFLDVMLSVPEAQDIVLADLNQQMVEVVKNDPKANVQVKRWAQMLLNFFADHKIERTEDNEFNEDDGNEDEEYRNLRDN